MVVGFSAAKRYRRNFDPSQLSARWPRRRNRRL